MNNWYQFNVICLSIFTKTLFWYTYYEIPITLSLWNIYSSNNINWRSCHRINKIDINTIIGITVASLVWCYTSRYHKLTNLINNFNNNPLSRVLWYCAFNTGVFKALFITKSGKAVKLNQSEIGCLIGNEYNVTPQLQDWQKIRVIYNHPAFAPVFARFKVVVYRVPFMSVSK